MNFISSVSLTSFFKKVFVNGDILVFQIFKIFDYFLGKWLLDIFILETSIKDFSKCLSFSPQPVLQKLCQSTSPVPGKKQSFEQKWHDQDRK